MGAKPHQTLSSPTGRLLQHGIQLLHQLLLGSGPHNRVLHLTISEEQQGRQAANLIPGYGLRMVVGVELGHFHAAGVLVCQFFHNRLQGVAGPAPGGAKINQHRFGGFQHFF